MPSGLHFFGHRGRFGRLGDKTCSGDQKCLTCNGKYHCGALDEEACCVGNQVTYNDVDVYKPANQLCCPMPDVGGNNLLCDNSIDECMAKVGGTHQQCVKTGSTACSATALCDPSENCYSCTGAPSVCGPQNHAACCNEFGTIFVIDPLQSVCCPGPNFDGSALACSLPATCIQATTTPDPVDYTCSAFP